MIDVFVNDIYFFFLHLWYPTTRQSFVKNFLRSISLKSVDKTLIKNTKIMGGGSQCSSLRVMAQFFFLPSEPKMQF